METNPPTSLTLTPIGVFCSHKKHAFEAARQASFDHGKGPAWVELSPGHNFEQALQGLEGFTHIWLIYQFHLNKNWHPVVQPPRGDKQGVFATRSPHRPNPIGMSVVEIEKIEGRKIFVRAHDILDGTPILDIKPYHVAADCFPEATQGWIADTNNSLAQFNIECSPTAEIELEFLAAAKVTEFKNFLQQQLSAEPLNSQKKRVFTLGSDSDEQRAVIAYRTWRALFSIDLVHSKISILKIYSGYSTEELREPGDRYQDKALHQEFNTRFPQAEALPRFRANADNSQVPKPHQR